MSEDLSSFALVALGTYALHSTLFLAAAWLFDICAKSAAPTLRITIWRTALVAALATTALQSSGAIDPLIGRLPLIVERSQVQSLPPIEAAPRTVESAPRATWPADDFAAVDAAPNRPLDRFEYRSTPQPPDWRVILAAGWAVIVAILISRLLAGWASVRRGLAGRTRLEDGPVFERLCALARGGGLKTWPKASVSDHVVGPFTLPDGEICLPLWTTEYLAADQLQAMLAHETAHVANRDSLWLVIARVIEAVFFFQPLNHLARRRMTDLSELAADDWAVVHAGDGRALAECLSTFAQISRCPPTPLFVISPLFTSGMAERPSLLVRRVERLLSGAGRPRIFTWRFAIPLAVGAVSLAGILPGVMARENPLAAATKGLWEASAAEAASPQLDGGPSPQTTATAEPEEQGGVIPAVAARPNSPVSPAAVASPAPPALVAPPNGGGLDSLFKTGMTWLTGVQAPPQPPAPPASEPFAYEVKPSLMNGVALSHRVAQLIEVGLRAAAVEREIQSRQIGQEGLIAPDMAAYAERAEISPALASRLVTVLDERPLSSSTLALGLKRVYEAERPTGQDLVDLINAGSAIGSDSEKQHLLVKVAGAAAREDATARAYLRLAATINSDTDMCQALKALAHQPALSEARLVDAIALAGQRMETDTNLSGLLQEIAERVGGSEAAARSYITATRSIGDSSDLACALRTLADEAALGPTAWIDLLNAVALIGSDPEKGDLLAEVAEYLPRDESLLAAYRAATASIGSDTWRTRAQRALT